MPEAINWPESTAYLWTGTATASALVSFCENINLTRVRGWDNRVAADGTYRDHLTGQYATLTIAALYTVDYTLEKLFESATAVHVHLKHNNLNGSAGFLLYSGRIDQVGIAGQNAQVFKWTMSYHANQWSGYGV